MNVPYNKSHSGSHVVQQWMDSYFGTTPEDCENIGYTTKSAEGSTDIYITTFGNSWFIDYQIKLLRLFFKSPFKIIVVDTNEDLNPEISAKLREICTGQCDVAYLKPPKNHYQEKQHFDSTMKLGTTLSFLFHNCVKQREPQYFGFLDHDCFLFKPTQMDIVLDGQGMYGTPSRNGEKWNLHVIANFVRYNYVYGLLLDFRASYKHGLDTGGANRDILYADKNIEDYILPHIGVRYTEEDICRKDAVQHYEIIDNRFFHVAATGHDQLVGDGEKKLLYAKGFLDAVIRLNS